ncbi:hypothetical protein BC628DRAFT_1003743 [Trametes gibbosa]|nr:hypothetical protein BC628DRAFT_1003743 [Trametes gibbosa]
MVHFKMQGAFRKAASRMLAFSRPQQTTDKMLRFPELGSHEGSCSCTPKEARFQLLLRHDHSVVARTPHGVRDPRAYITHHVSREQMIFGFLIIVCPSRENSSMAMALFSPNSPCAPGGTILKEALFPSSRPPQMDMRQDPPHAHDARSPEIRGQHKIIGVDARDLP